MTSERAQSRVRDRSRRTGPPTVVTMVVAALALAVAAGGPAAASVASAAASAAAPAGPAGRADPYLTLGWGSPPDPVAVMGASGIRQFTLAFMLAGQGCTPRWDGSRPLLGGTDAASIAAIRAAGGDVSVSFGGWSGRKLGAACHTAAALAAAYEQVVDAYGLHAVDVDIEHGEFTNARVRLRVVTALALLQAARPGIAITITFGTSPTGPDATGRSLIADAAGLGFQPFAWTIMPFDFGMAVADMGATSVAAAEGLHTDLMAAYGDSSADAYAHMGISTMNGRTDEADETVSTADFQTILAYARTDHLARVTFWMVDRDRSCPSGTKPGNTCSGIAQADWAFTSLDAGFGG